MKIEIWSDFACPFCYIGEKKLEKALEELEVKEAIDIRFRSFQLDVNAKSQSNMDVHQYLANKYGMTYEEAKASNQKIVKAAEEVGLNFDFDNLKLANTRLAHELLKYAEEQGKASEVAESLFSAYFEEGIDVENPKNLLRIAKTSGLNQEKVQEIFDHKTYSQEVIRDQQTANEMGVNSVPFFVINDKYSVSGAQSVEHFKAAIDAALDVQN